jgi:hypothetical protein
MCKWIHVRCESEPASAGHSPPALARRMDAGIAADLQRRAHARIGMALKPCTIALILAVAVVGSSPVSASPLPAALGGSSAKATQQNEAAPCHTVRTSASPGYGCIVLGRQALGALPRTAALYWYIDIFDSAKAADSAKAVHSMVFTSHNKVVAFHDSPF